MKRERLHKPWHTQAQNTAQLLQLGQDGLLSLRLALLELLDGVFPLVLLPPLDGRKLLALDLGRLLDHLGQVSVAGDTLDLGHVGISLDQGFVVLERLSLLGRLDAAALRGIGTPQADVTLYITLAVLIKQLREERRQRTSSLPLRRYLESMVQVVRNTLCIRLVW